MLSPYRVLDLTDTRAELGPMILADLGAEVVKVEPPGGGESRRAEPLVAGAPEGMASLRFHAFNRGKRSVTLDLDGPEGRAAFLDLVRGADFLVENGEPGAMAARGLGFDDLAKVNPGLVYVAITPFGQDGPYASHATTDLILAAMGGMMALNGDPDRAPVRVSVPQCWSHAAAESALAALVAHFRRLATGEGQYVDLSVQASVFWTGLNAMIAAAIDKDIQRAGTLLQLGIIDMPLVYRCADGEAVIAPTGVTMRKLLNWMIEDGVIPPSWLTDEEWATYDLRFLTGQPLKIPVDTVIGKLQEYTPRHTKGDLFQRGIREGTTVAPVTTTADVLAFDHLHERGYWQDYALPGDGTVKMPGPFVRLAKAPIGPQRPAPAPGQDNAAMLGQPRTPAPAGNATLHGGLPFAGLKVADFSWIGVGPITAKYLGDHGATVVRIEAGNPVDRLRGAGPHKDGIPGTNRSQFYGAFNTSKLGLNMNLKRPEAREVAKRLLAWCDVALESFTPGTMADLGLGYEVAKELNPGIIMVSTCLMGQTGPASSLAGYGYHAAAISGFYEVTGWDDRPPGGPFNAYTDVIAPHFLGATVMAALDHRRRTGEGQYIEQAQMESALYFLAPELLDCQVSGRNPRRMGNASATAAPHGAYPSAGKDQWVAIAVETDEQWRAFRTALGDPEWARDPAYATAAGRIAARKAIDAEIAAFTATRDRYEVMALLQRHGVPAGAVQRSSDLLRDPQMAHRHFFHPLEHPEMGLVPYEGHQFNIRGYESGPRFPAPLLGQHSFEVLTEVLGMSSEAAAEVMASGAVE
ncbi:MAG: CoA transferase [Chloroflexi bacterium]|nr:CoA transferase [Chloroflexota bacterium]